MIISFLAVSGSLKTSMVMFSFEDSPDRIDCELSKNTGEIMNESLRTVSDVLSVLVVAPISNMLNSVFFVKKREQKYLCAFEIFMSCK